MTSEEKREYYRKYRELNKGKIKENHKKFRQKNKDKLRVLSKEYHKNNKDKEKAYREKNKTKLKAQGKIYRNNNKEKAKSYNKKYRETNKDKLKSYSKKYRELNKEKRKLYRLKRNQEDFLFRITERVRGLIKDAFRRNGYSKNSKTQEILGCTFDELKKYIESKWQTWMDWNNYGKYNGQLNYGWDLDHIIPLCTAKTKEEIIKLSHHSNLQPLCSKTNRHIKKGDF